MKWNEKREIAEEGERNIERNWSKHPHSMKLDVSFWHFQIIQLNSIRSIQFEWFNFASHHVLIIKNVFSIVETLLHPIFFFDVFQWNSLGIVRFIKKQSQTHLMIERHRVQNKKQRASGWENRMFCLNVVF